jgi:uncharacterized protein YukJ
MSLQNYGVLAGSIKDALDSPAAMQKNPGSKPHFQILVQTNNVQYRIAVNVKSDQQPSDLQFYLNDDYKHPVLDHIKDLPAGFSKLDNKPNTAALDYIRGNLFDFNDLRIVPSILSGPDNDLNDIFNIHVKHAIDTTGALVYAFGSRWGPETNKKDEYFDFLPGNGIHDIHMNQGNTGRFAKDNGIYQDGGLFIYYPLEQRWVAMFLKFQSQVVHTDDQNADPIEPLAQKPGLPKEKTAIKIFAALVNPKTDDVGKETVYLLNTTDKDINLEGWMIADKLKKKEVIRGITLSALDTVQIKLSGQAAQLSNEGGIITLLDSKGLKIDGVSYIKKDVEEQGTLVTF